MFVTILLTRNLVQYFFIFFFILLDSPKKSNKQINKTNKQRERTLAGIPQQVWPITAGPDTNLKEKKTRNIKKHSDTRKTTATYNELLDETRGEHYYILNR